MITSLEFLKFAAQIGYEGQVVWSKQAASRATWSAPQSRSGVRPLRVDTVLRKEKDGTLVKLAPKVKEEEKTSALSQPGGADYSEPGTDPSAARLRKPAAIPSRDDTAESVRREDSRGFAATEPGPGTFLNDTGPQPAYIKSGSLNPLVNEHAADVLGLAPMLVGGADKLQGELRGSPEGYLGSKAQTALDLGGLGVMALPHLKKLTGPSGSGVLKKYVEPLAVLGGLGALALPTADTLQAKLRSEPGEDKSQKQLLDRRTHDLLELAGYGTFGGMSASDAVKNHSALDALHAAGYGILAAPHVENLAKDQDDPKFFSGATRAATDLLGVGTLAGATIAHMGHGPSAH